ncbi:MAG: hypothetical protein M1812_000499 [Candelaria pacifica]|nr:MAG: hypothetical protein M1812_000499 [Candelaria pacifica]
MSKESSTLAAAAQSGFSNASSYDQNRPSYPPEAVDKLLTHLYLNDMPEAQIVDLAAGTGKFTELLANRKEGYEIIAIEPHEAMRRELEKKELKGVVVKDGYAAHIPLEDQSVDAVIASQPINKRWVSMLTGVGVRFANDEALKEIHRIIRQAGVFGMIWNVEDYNQPEAWNATTDWEAKVKAITWSFDDGTPRFRHEKWRDVFDAQLRSTPVTAPFADPLFTLPIGEESVPFAISMSKEKVWERYSTLSQIANLKGEKEENVKRKVLKAIEDSNEKNEKGEVIMHGCTFFAWTTRI